MRGIVFLYRALHRQIFAAAMRVAVISLYLMRMFGQNQFDDLLSKRDDINAELQRIIDQQTEP
jgi:regulator of protease activity HflC (stomatin/prohibitin superfamily)